LCRDPYTGANAVTRLLRSDPADRDGIRIAPARTRVLSISALRLMYHDILSRNNVQVFGQGETAMVFAHGFGCDQHMWRFVAPAFADEYRIVLFDYVGSGRSDLRAYDPARYASLDGYATDLLDVCLALDLRGAVLVGHSVSAMVGVLAANRAPGLFSSLVMVGPSPRYLNDAADGYVGGFERADIEGLLDMMDHNYVGWASFLAPQVMANGDRPELATELEASFCSTDPVIARRFAEATFYADNRADLARVRVPALVMQCSSDIIAPEVVGTYVRDRLADATLRKLSATGHCPHLSHPQETIEVMRAYLAERQSASSATLR
jgi:sigma-B regulation protein RsbQ